MSNQSVGVTGVTSFNKIPEYAREFKNEYLFIRGINKTCERFVKRLDSEAKIFNTPQAYQLMLYTKRFVKAKELGYLEDSSEFKFEESDVKYIESLELQLDDYMALFYDLDSGKFDQKKYGFEYQNLREFYECFERFKSKVYIKEMTYSDFEREYFNEDLAKKIKEAKETNNLEKERILKGFSRLYSICLNINKIMNDYEDCEEFDEIRTFFSYVSQIFCNYIESYIEDKKISLELLETILNCLVYEYAFCGFHIDEGKNFLILRKCVLRGGFG